MQNTYEKMDVRDIEKIQKLLKNLLYRFHTICEENNLIYNLYGGTLLGAVRHEDMIPWDDDIDVSMPRKDYEKFIKIVNEKYSDKYDVYSYPRENYIYAFGKFCDKNTLLIENNLRSRLSKFALYIDIFPLDGYPDLPDDKLKARFDYMRRLKSKKCKAVFKVTTSKVIWKKPYAIIKFLNYLPERIRGYKYYLDREVEESLKYSFESCKYISCPVSWQEKGCMLKEDYFNRRLYQLGEYSFWGVSEYDRYLTKLYGDYMKLPSEENRISNHNYELYFIK